MKATHVVLRRFTGGEPSRELSPGDRVTVQGDGWRNARTLETARYIRPLTPEEFSGVDAGPETAVAEKAPRGKRKEVAA